VLDTLDPQHGVNARENAAIVLGAIARSNVSPLTHKLGAYYMHRFIRRQAGAPPGDAMPIVCRTYTERKWLCCSSSQG